MQKTALYHREIEDTFTHYNIQRIYITCIILLFLQVFIFLDSSYLGYPICILGFSILSFTIIVYFIIYLLYHYHILKTLKKYLYRYFWLLFCLGFIPYIQKDIMQGTYPIMMTLSYLMLVSLPIFTTKEMFFSFIGFGLINILFSLRYSLDISIYIYILFLTSSSLLICHYVQYQYHSLIYRLKETCDTDYLTNVSNRKGGIEKLKDMLVLCKRHHIILGVCMIDVDYFKDYNDFYGHIQGDLALQKIASCFKQTMQRKNDVVCRFGGEEFLICFTCHTKAEIESIALKLNIAIAKLEIPCCFHETLPNLTVSIGSAAYIPGQEDSFIDELTIIKRADDALYQAKRNGRNQVFNNIIDK